MIAPDGNDRPPAVPAGVLAGAVDGRDRRARARRVGLPSFLFGLLSQVHRLQPVAPTQIAAAYRVAAHDAPRQHPAARRPRPRAPGAKPGGRPLLPRRADNARRRCWCARPASRSSAPTTRSRRACRVRSTSTRRPVDELARRPRACLPNSLSRYQPDVCDDGGRACPRPAARAPARDPALRRARRRRASTGLPPRSSTARSPQEPSSSTRATAATACTSSPRASWRSGTTAGPAAASFAATCSARSR